LDFLTHRTFRPARALRIFTPSPEEITTKRHKQYQRDGEDQEEVRQSEPAHETPPFRIRETRDAERKSRTTTTPAVDAGVGLTFSTSAIRIAGVRLTPTALTVNRDQSVERAAPF
jgi:hypothetical protein